MSYGFCFCLSSSSTGFINEEISISGISSSSKLIKENECFIALQGISSHGVDYIDEAQMNQRQSCVISKFHEFVLPMLKSVCKKMGVDNIDILQGRSFLQFPLNLKDRSVDRPHQDLWDTNKFFVVLYYVCDSDGDTIIYNETGNSDVYTLKQKVSPKKGRVVIFDGALMHTAEQPLNNTRCVINYNLGLRY